MTQAGKAVALISTFGAISGVGAYAGGLFSSSSSKAQETKSAATIIVKVSNRSSLEKEGFEVLDTSKDSPEWKAVLEEYKKATVKSFTKKQEADKSEESLRNNCKDILDKEKDTNYPLARQWCVKKQKISEVLKKGKRKLLNFEESEVEGEKVHWEAKIAELKKDKSKFASISGNIKDQETEVGDNIKAFKAGCKALETDTIETTNDKFETNFALAREWCSVDEQ
ncbi:hypothetical protein A6V39_00630 [Candidatus Mycoplasma haematobovis]|uniref:Uncharacterized protein n=1 Tax=Candidatus Mycoplasma haematobovis TaxID=432608 RepID=A0A1A9QF26_9MOLU|nr:hypothetical protein [Candidatus Mycoplasma haematobovis]OAL10556.1 hypothetical protein A6V39_00630 [Candidatus Mycoplasma haematobovis]